MTEKCWRALTMEQWERKQLTLGGTVNETIDSYGNKWFELNILKHISLNGFLGEPKPPLPLTDSRLLRVSLTVVIFPFV